MITDINTNIRVLRWINNGMVQALSTFVGPELASEVNRWSGKEKKIVSVPCPTIIHQYTKYMGELAFAVC